MKQAASVDQWLVRTSRNELIGPLSKQALILQIQEGKFGPEDEVCQADHYWIYLDEREEVQRQLGIEIQRAGPDPEDDEITDTETLTTEMLSQAMVPQGGSGDPGDPGNPDAPSEGRSFRRMDRKGFRAAEPRPLVLGRVEKPSFWRLVISILLILAALLVAWVVRLLQTAR